MKHYLIEVEDEEAFVTRAQLDGVSKVTDVEMTPALQGALEWQQGCNSSKMDADDGVPGYRPYAAPDSDWQRGWNACYEEQAAEKGRLSK